MQLPSRRTRWPHQETPPGPRLNIIRELGEREKGVNNIELICRALNNAGYYLQPFVDAVFERFGMNVSLLLCGPIPDRGGRIEMRSVHAGTTNGLVPRIWSDVDRAGFDAAQRSFVQFSHQCFSKSK
jgi:hypothetical protein